MNIDSCTISLKSDQILTNTDKLTKITKTNPETGTINTYFEAKKIMPGFSSITHFPGTNETVIDISGKILHLNHKQLININNIEEVVYNLNNSGLVQFEISDLILNSEVRKVDITENIQVDDEVNDYISALHYLNPRNYKKQNYPLKAPKKDITGLTFIGKYKTKKEYMVFYNKEQETNNPFYKNIVRAESNRTTFKSIRDDIQGNNNLNDILNSREKPVLKLVKKIIGENEINVQFMDQEIYSYEQLFYEMLYRQTNNDTEAARERLKSIPVSRHTQYRHIKKFENYCFEREANDKAVTKLNELVTKLEQQ